MSEKAQDHESGCIICGRPVNPSDMQTLTAILEDGSEVHAHRRCAEGVSRLIQEVGHRADELGQLGGLVKKIEGKWVLMRHDFPNQYMPILLFYQLHRNNPLPIEELRTWLNLNRMNFSNPSVPVKRLVRRGALTVMVGEDNATRYFITALGIKKLNNQLKELSEEA